MGNKKRSLQILFFAALIFCACTSSKNICAKYYQLNEKALADIEHSYKTLFAEKPFSLEFTDHSFNFVSVEMITDTIKYIYEFGIHELRLKDSLEKYHFNETAIIDLINQMQAIHCIWVNTLGYYTSGKKNNLILISMHPVGLSKPFTQKKYYILVYFPLQQYFDTEGKLLARKKQNRLRKINGDIYWRINDKVSYTISGRFR